MTKQNKARVLLMESNSFNIDGTSLISPTNWLINTNIKIMSNQQGNKEIAIKMKYCKNQLNLLK